MAYPLPLVDAAAVLQHVADILHRPLSEINVVAADQSGRYARQAALYAPQAYRDMLAALGLRGYTASQVDTSDQGVGCNRDQAAWYVLRDDANLPNVAKLQWQKEYDWTDRWKTLTLTVGGVPVAPAAPLLKAAYQKFDDRYDRWTRDSWL